VLNLTTVMQLTTLAATAEPPVKFECLEVVYVLLYMRRKKLPRHSIVKLVIPRSVTERTLKI
jgi:hypothetical protein